MKNSKGVNCGRSVLPAALGLLLTWAPACSSGDQSEALGWHSSTLEEVSLEDCVAAHIASAGGDPLAVSRLSCPVSTPSGCSDPSETDLSPLASLSAVREVDLTGRCIADLARIGSLTQLTRLELAHNAITDLSPIGTLKKLNYLGLADNPYAGALGRMRREPFSELPELTELVLDGTPLDNALALAQARKLRKLSLRRVDTLSSLQSLAALSGLHSLNIDDMMVSDLSGLSVLTELRELSAERTLVNSVEPLRALVTRHRLRTVSLRGTCVESCAALAGANHDCSEPRPNSECFIPEEEFMLFGTHLAVPLHSVERFAPKNLPVWTEAQLAQGYELARTAPHIDWRNAASNCDGRANQTLALLRSNGLPEATQAVSYGNLRLLSDTAPFGFYWFDFHIAVAVRAQVGGKTAFFVIDPALDETRPMPIAAWFLRQLDSAGNRTLDFACQPYTERHSIGSCTHLVDSEGDFLVDSPSLLRGAVCPDEFCVPHF